MVCFGWYLTDCKASCLLRLCLIIISTTKTERTATIKIGSAANAIHGREEGEEMEVVVSSVGLVGVVKVEVGLEEKIDRWWVTLTQCFEY